MCVAQALSPEIEELRRKTEEARLKANREAAERQAQENAEKKRRIAEAGGKGRDSKVRVPEPSAPQCGNDSHQMIRTNRLGGREGGRELGREGGREE
jgi:hypothetical protein